MNVWSRCCRLDLQDLGGAVSKCGRYLWFLVSLTGIRRLLIPLLGRPFAMLRLSSDVVLLGQIWEITIQSPVLFSIWAAMVRQCSPAKLARCLPFRYASAQAEPKAAVEVPHCDARSAARRRRHVFVRRASLLASAAWKFRLCQCSQRGTQMSTLPCTTVTGSEVHPNSEFLGKKTLNTCTGAAQQWYGHCHPSIPSH